MNRTAIISKVNEVVDLANKKYGVGLASPTVKFFDVTATAGWAFPSHNILKFNEVLAKENPDTFYETIIHEVAHLVTKKMFPRAKQAHGPEFKSIDAGLGGRGTRCHSYDVSSVKVSKTKTRYELKCSCQTHWVTKSVYTKSLSPRNRLFCKSCKGTVTPTHKTKTYI